MEDSRAGRWTAVRGVDELRDLLAAGALRVHVQPIVALSDGRLLGAEALARLDTGADLLAPASFIPLAEASGLIVELGARVLEAACAAAAGWRREPGREHVYVSVNVAAQQLEHAGFAELVRRVLRRQQLPASALVLELTESAYVGTSQQALTTLEVLAAAGVRLAVDDFGTGFATLDTVKRFPVHVLKLDRGFVSGLGEDVVRAGRRGTDVAIVRAVLGLANSLGLSVVAEGVETAEQADLLTSWGCAAAQGFYFGRPAPELIGPTAAARPVQSAWADEVSLSPAQRSIALALARVLATLDGDGGTRRCWLHAVATALSRALRLPPAAVSDIGRLALVHDLERVATEPFSDLSLLARCSPLPATAAAVVGLVLEGLPVAVACARIAASTDALDGPPSLVQQALERVASEAGGLLRAEWPALAASLDGSDGAVETLETRLRSLAALSRTVASARHVTEILELAAKEARLALGAASVSISRWDRENGAVRTIVNVGDLGPGEEQFPVDETYPVADFPLALRMLQSGLPHIQSVDDDDSDGAERQLLRALGKTSCVSVPITLEDRLWGELYATRGQGAAPYVPGDIDLVVSVAGILGSAIIQAEHLERVERLALRDPLTDLANRRAVDERLERALDAQADPRDGHPVTLVVADVNGLKQVNDDFGHAEGDRVLCAVADALSAAASEVAGALAARIGGDEFCLVLPGADAALTERVVDEVARRLADAPPPQVTVSAGAAVGRPGGLTPRELLAAADRAQYSAKTGAALLVVHQAGSQPSGPPPEDERRLGRRRARDTRPAHDPGGSVADALTEAVRALADLPATAGPRERLTALAEAVSGPLDLNRWVLCRGGPDGALAIEAMRLRRARPAPAPGRQAVDDADLLRGHPLSGAAIGGEPVLVRAGGDDADVALDGDPMTAPQRWLSEAGMLAVLLLGHRDGSTGWLLELYADDRTADLSGLVPLARLLTRG